MITKKRVLVVLAAVEIALSGLSAYFAWQERHQ
jgi:hypothetical protein